MKKYELTENTIERDGTTLYQVRYLQAFRKEGVKVGDLGGYVESEENFSHEGSCLILDEGISMGNARVTMDSYIRHRGMIRGDVILAGTAKILHDAIISGRAVITGNARICHRAQVSGRAIIGENVELMFDSQISGYTVLAGAVCVRDNAYISMNELPEFSIHPAHLYESVKVSGKARITDDAILFGVVEVTDNAEISGKAVVSGETKIMGSAGIGEQVTITGTVEVSGKSIVKGNCIIAGTILVKDSLIQGDISITGRASITGGCSIYDKAIVANSIMMNGAQLHQSVNLRNSKLDGTILVGDFSEIRESEISGQDIVIKESASLFQVEIKYGKDIKILGKSKLDYVLMEDCESFRTYDDTVLNGESDQDKIVISGKDITLGNNATIGSSVIIDGNHVSIMGHSYVTGKVMIGNYVTLFEMVVVENKRSYTPYPLSKIQIGMDTRIVVS